LQISVFRLCFGAPLVANIGLHFGRGAQEAVMTPQRRTVRGAFTALGAVATAALVLGLAPSSAGAHTAEQQLASDLGAGNGPAAAAVIVTAGMSHQPAVLSAAIYDGVLIALPQHRGDAFAHAVAYALPHGGVSITDASITFGLTAGKGVAGGLTFEETHVGIETVTLTYLAYLN
jgi:hypothetical protein